MKTQTVLFFGIIIGIIVLYYLMLLFSAFSRKGKMSENEFSKLAHMTKKFRKADGVDFWLTDAEKFRSLAEEIEKSEKQPVCLEDEK